MNKPLIICDRVMYGGLLMLIFWLPYSLMMISVCEGITAAAWVARRFLTGRFDFPAGRMLLPLAGLALLIALTIPFSHAPSVSLQKLGTRFLYQIILMCVTVEVVRSRKRLCIVLGTLLFTVFVTCLDAFFQYAYGHDIFHHITLVMGRVTGPMNAANDLGTMLVTVLPAALVVLVTSPRKIPAAVVFAALLFALGLTVSRGAWVAFIVSMVALGIFFQRWKMAVAMALVMTLFFWGFGMYCLSARLDIYNIPMHQSPELKPGWTNPWGLPAQFNAWEVLSSSSGRSTYWDTAMAVIKRSPVTGCGFGSYMKALKDIGYPTAEYPHDSLLHITAELGLIGLALYIWLFAAFWLQVRDTLVAVGRDRNIFLLGSALACGVLAWLVHSLFDTPWSSFQLSMLLWAVIGLLFSLSAVISDKERCVCR